MNETLKTDHGPNYSIVHAGELKDFRRHVFKHPVLGDTPGKLFLKAPLQLTGMEISIGTIAPGRGTNHKRSTSTRVPSPRAGFS